MSLLNIIEIGMSFSLSLSLKLFYFYSLADTTSSRGNFSLCLSFSLSLPLFSSCLSDSLQPDREEEEMVLRVWEKWPELVERQLFQGLFFLSLILVPVSRKTQKLNLGGKMKICSVENVKQGKDTRLKVLSLSSNSSFPSELRCRLI